MKTLCKYLGTASLILFVSCSNHDYFDRVVKASADYPPADATMALMEKVANWQLPRLEKLDYIKDERHRAASERPKGWVQGAFYTGLIALAERSDNPTYEKWIEFKGEEWNWELGHRIYNADDHVIGQTYLWYHARNGGDHVLAPMKARFDEILANPSPVSLEWITRKDKKKPCKDRWCWADALFMAPPTWMGLSDVTGDPRYAEFANKEFKETVAHLLDPKTKLLFRDSRFKTKTGKFGEAVFWSRGVGWVFAGIANTMKYIPEDHPDRDFYVNLYLDMAASVKSLQRADGTWAMSLLAKDKIPQPETSGTAFFTYGMAWGIKNGLLSKEEYWPNVAKGWAALQSALHPSGKLGWVQRIGASPGDVSYEDSQIYGTGAFLLAGSMIYDLAKENAK